MKKKIFSVGIFILVIIVTFCANANDAYKSGGSVGEKQLSFAAHVYFSNQQPLLGIATEGKEFDIDPSNGSFLYLIVDNYPNNFSYDQIRMKAYKIINGTNQSYDDKTYNISTTLYYTYIKYSFYSDGNYEFDIYDKSGNLVGSTTVTIYYKKSSSQAISTNNSNSNSSDPYASSRVYFSTEAPIGTDFVKDVKTFEIKHSGGYVYVIADNYPTYFTVKSVKLYVYIKLDGEYKQIDVQTYTMKENFHDYLVYFKYTFHLKGDYKFILYDGMDKYINTGYVTIKYKGLF